MPRGCIASSELCCRLWPGSPLLYNQAVALCCCLEKAAVGGAGFFAGRMSAPLPCTRDWTASGGDAGFFLAAPGAWRCRTKKEQEGSRALLCSWSDRGRPRLALQTGGYDSSRGDVRRELGRCLPCRGGCGRGRKRGREMRGVWGGGCGRKLRVQQKSD